MFKIFAVTLKLIKTLHLTHICSVFFWSRYQYRATSSALLWFKEIDRSIDCGHLIDKYARGDIFLASRAINNDKLLL